MTAAQPPGPPAGWYPDPDMVNTQRYWDGQRWTEHRAPVGGGATATPAPAPKAKVKPDPSSPEEKDRTAKILGAGYLAAIILPILGFIIGLTQIRRSTGHAVAIMAVSVLVAYLAYQFL